MTWIHRLKSNICHFLAIQQREAVRRHMASALDRLDDRLLADIGVPRNRIEEYAHAAAHKAVPVASRPASGRKSVLARLKSWMERQAAIRELSALDDRLLRDIGIEPGRIRDVVDAGLSRRRDLGMAHPTAPLSGTIQAVLVPVRHRSRVPAVRSMTPIASARAENGAKTGADWTPDVHALRKRTANENRSAERRSRALAEM